MTNMRSRLVTAAITEKEGMRDNHRYRTGAGVIVSVKQKGKKRNMLFY